MANPKPLLVVDDEDSDALLVKLALEQAQITVPMLRLRDGQELIDHFEAVNYLGESGNLCLPGLLLLDLKMPRVDGFAVLAWRAPRRELRNIPTVVFSASNCETDRKKALALGATDYLAKPSQFRELVRIMQSLHARFFEGSEMPEGKAVRVEVPR